MLPGNRGARLKGGIHVPRCHIRDACYFTPLCRRSSAPSREKGTIQSIQTPFIVSLHSTFFLPHPHTSNPTPHLTPLATRPYLGSWTSPLLLPDDPRKALTLLWNPNQPLPLFNPHNTTRTITISAIR